ncbi:CxC2 domain-containing protein [Mycena indigotica]|uniref:CxC2 domain-containing protein n=1 Tax=Mycena indigotica TaxID=2126181 RepID=A0A8H6WBA4_9AGAR|nr:CxC2 domain-containing protein [Mycena indigotica]KAF7310021.1 CxC2 domain-containing protein [Mycena indigotica]
MSRQRKRKPKVHVGGLPPSQVQGDTSVHFLTSGRNTSSRLLNLAPTAATRVQATEDLAEWMPFLDLADEELAAIALTISSEPQPLEDDQHAGKRKRTASDDPMALWRPMMRAYLDELIRGETLGRHGTRPSCAACGESLGEGSNSRAFRCTECGPSIHCEECLRSRHEQLPLHSPQVRPSSKKLTDFWRKSTLFSRSGLGMVYQLGHHGFPCPYPESRVRTLVVIDVGGIFKVDVRFCACSASLRHKHMHLSQLLDNAWYPATTMEPATCATFRVLDLFRTLKVVGNMNAHDFVGSLERMTNATFTEQVPDRYKAFGRMSRQYDFLLHIPAGGLAVHCWACPDPNRNLPEGWDTVDKSKSYLYSLMLALDANFRLKNRIRGNERNDPSLGSGLGYFVELNQYKEHLRHYVAEEDVSTCIAFAALMQKETRLTTGLRVSGVGGCVCARHGLVRPLGLGDLQKGSGAYANMDWIFLNAVGGAGLKRLVVSYDIACQWQQHIRERAKKLHDQELVTTQLDDYALQFALPVWHAVAHESSCQAANSLTHAVGVGRTDGEGIERTWAILNPIAFSTKEMGEGNRHDTIEDKVDHVNFEKNVKQGRDDYYFGFTKLITNDAGDTLARKMIIALAERDQQVREFNQVDDSLEPSLREEWQLKVDAWNADKTCPNPYLSDAKHAGPSEAQILADLKKSELEQLRSGRGSELGAGRTTAAAFIKGALQLEDQQRRIRFEASGTMTLTAERSSVEELRSAEEEKRDADLPPPPAETTKLWLPSDLSVEQREAICRPALVEIEAQLRLGQCADALGKIRGHLHAKTHLIDTRNANAVGQSSSTRFGTLIGRVGDQARRQANKYREARLALLRLKGPEFAPQFRELRDEDLRVHVESESDAKARAALGKLGSTRRARNEPPVTKKMLPVSWIWFAGGEADKEELHDSVRVQWTKSRARRDRWIEEVHLLREEMRRVIKSVEVVQREWKEREQLRDDVDEELAAGLTAYAKRQAYIYRGVEEAFRASWGTSGVAAIRAAAVVEPLTTMTSVGED